ncbi:chromosome segregation protein SMC [Ruania halotolerans]|uniref:chromosome segregation protein SMC n=1 Tax=Ruania halotolerans TaxID=2897773 RepID=UPI001E3F0420|nr:chromosome segregation protein SMC [Ruania halotolerans]UFU05225.1 chromosome segregation protein SMC [Ruania halotolerans]
MHLKTLTLRGFKSFASATTLRLEPGITCVVGPNGSGKSNVVDALSWVMGEQGVKSLRGGAMADVIFAGTSSRPPLGRAEVSLTIDNADGALPIEYSEVTISRTLFRNGGSEYAINGASCRLLDIQDLLSDSGLGREMHVIVGQGRLDAVLQATPEERRGFIEEAAGVLKHRKRKEKSLRKLEAMAGNLARVSDLTSEIRRQLGPLAKQADVARRAHVVQVDLRDAKARLLADDLVQLTSTLAQEVADETALRQERDQVEAAQQEARARLTRLEADAAAAAPALSEATEMWYRLSSLRERLRGTHTLAAERCRLLGSPAAADEQRTDRDPADLDAQAARAREAEAELGTEAGKARDDLEAAVAERTDAEQKSAEAEKALAAVHRGVADRREGLARLTGQVAATRGKVEAAEEELERLRRDLASAQERSEAAGREFAALEQQAVGATEGEEDLDAAHEKALAALDTAKARVSELIEAEREADGAKATHAARRDALELSLARKDGTGTVLEAGLVGVLGPVADLLTVEPGYETALAAALGPLADAAAVESVDVAVDALRHVRTEDAGQARLLLAHDGPPRQDPPPAPDGARWAVELVHPAESVRGAIELLLDGVLVVDDLSAARKVRGQVLGGPVADRLVTVTRDGDVIGPAHARGGSTGGPSVLELHAARDEAQSELTAAVQRAEQTRFALGPAREALQSAQTQVDRTLDALHDSDAQLAAVAEKLGQHGAAMRAAAAEIERIKPAIERADQARREHAADLAEIAERLEFAQREPDEAATDLTGATTERDRATEAATSARARETDARLVLRTVEERVRAIAGRAESLERAARAEREAREAAARRARRRAEQAEVAAAVRAGAEQALTAIESSLALAATRREAAEDERANRDEALTRVRGELDTLATRHSELTDVVHRDEVARAQQKLRIEQLEQRAVEELGIDPEVLVTEYGPDQLVPPVHAPGSEEHDADGQDRPPQARPYVRAEQEKRLRAAERALKLLGRVNPLALEEHAALEERHRFLTEQLADLKKSRADLLDIIAQIDERVEHVFTSAYEETAIQFKEVFSRLFPGGEGRLVLTDPGDMLTTGIDVEARPPGKKVKRLSLLSGGERSLTAVALLVAIFKARPSPFYVMDEVEAALDDVNLGRLLEIFTELRSDSQLIVVTHQKRTMEIADALYGVTMRGDGVTTLISQRIHDRAEETA